MVRLDRRVLLKEPFRRHWLGNRRRFWRSAACTLTLSAVNKCMSAIAYLSTESAFKIQMHPMVKITLPNLSACRL